MTTPEEIKAEYTSSLSDLTFNSKPLINVLTMLAEENLSNAKVIVEAIETHLSKVNTDVKLPILYLIDCIVKNVGRTYTSFFAQNIVQTFCNVFRVVDEKTRAEMFKLRQTWNDVFPQMKLYAIDVKINMLDPAWPVTAKPSSSIHFNPKFFNPAATSTPTPKVSTVATPAITTPAVGNIDKETLLMQEKLIQKQKELLELQQKKLELEVLQTKVKLQEQIKAVNPPNILMKPEVAKQLIPDVVTNTKSNKPLGIGSSVMHQRLQNNLGSQLNRINPVSPTLASAKPIRDPRLLRQQQQIQKSNNNSQSNSSSLGAQLGQKSQSSNLENNNKNVTSKLGVKDIRKDPRLSNKSDSINNKQTSKTSPKSRSQQVLQSLDAEQVTNNAQKIAARSGIKSGTDFEKLSLSSRSSSSSLDSPTKYNKSTNSSPRKNRKNKSNRQQQQHQQQQQLLLSNEPSNNTSVTTNKNVTVSSVTKEPLPLNNKRDKQNFIKRGNLNSFKNVNDIECPPSNINVSSSSNSTFRGVKKSTKDRNYIRRNLSESPEPPQDEDLRSFAAPPEKQPRIQSDSMEEKVTSSPAAKEIEPIIPTNKGMDVDLRQLPAVITKKRTSTDAPEIGSAKKSKSEMFDVLFGNEDTDLRQLPVSTERPPTPPPPIISTSDPVSQNPTPSGSPKKAQNNDFEAIRAKLANATSKDKLMTKSFHKKKLAAAAALEDQDLRIPTVSATTDLPRNAILISPEDEKKIKSGEMTKEQQTLLLNKIFMQIEKGKLHEAKQKDKEDSIGNISLQPISDEELDLGDSYNEESRVHVVSNSDKDERFRAPHFYNMPPSNENVHGPGLQHQMPQQFYPRDQRPRYPPQPWRGGPNWRGRGRGMNQPMMPMARPPIRPPRMGVPPKWRNMPPNFPQPPIEYIPPQDEDSNTDLQVEHDKMANTSILQCEIKTINIDGTPRDIRYYGDTAVVFLNWDDPREISFQAGVRRVIFNDNEMYMMAFGDPYKECMIDGVLHRVKLGGPSREIVIDDVGYECFFGGAAITVGNPSGEHFMVQLEGPIPQVKIGDVKLTDLVAGKINLIINAKLIVPVFLDAKTQRVVIDGETCTLRFVDALRTVLINDVPFNVEFGGLPKPFTINGKKHFIRFSVLPKGIRPGYVRIRDMEGQALGEGFSPRMDETSQDSGSGDAIHAMAKSQQKGLTLGTGGESPDGRSNSPSFLQNLLQPNLNNLDVLSNALSNTMVPAPPPTTGGYQIENILQPNRDDQDTTSKHMGTIVPPPTSVNINELFQKLVASGFVQSEVVEPAPPRVAPVVVSQNKKPVQPAIPPQKPTSKSLESDNTAPVKSIKRSIIENLRPVTFDRPETFKLRQGALYLALYTGLQCSSCGMRFPPESTIQYSQHLDWHFRQNRKGKKNIRVASSRRWYFSLADWKNYEEIEDLEEREKNYFDQQQQAETVSEDMDEDVEVPSVPADPESTDQCCEVCRDKFDQFFHEEKEEWHLKNAIEVDDKIYHPVCFDDYQQSLLECSVEELKSETEVKPKEPSIIPGLEIILDDDDEEDRQTAPSPSPGDIVSLEESDDSKPPTEARRQSMENQDEDDDDDDVILNEVAPIKIVVDDDDEDESVGQNSEKAQQKMEQAKVKKEKHVDDDGFVDVGEGLVSLNKVGQIKIKSEPMDLDDSRISSVAPTPTPEEVPIEQDWSQDVIEVLPVDFLEDDAYIDGNDELASSAPPAITTNVASMNRIKINISKPMSVINKEKDATSVTSESVIGLNEPYPPGVEPEVINLKPELQGVALKKLSPVKKGAELTGLCSIM